MSSSSSTTKETRYIGDVLEEDPVYPNAKFVGLSFISPEKILKQKEIFLFEKFVNSWDFVKSMKKYNDFLHFISEKFNLKIDVLLKDYQDFLKEEEPKLRAESILDDYKTFLDLNEERLMETFNKEHGFQTSVRSVKIRTPTVSTREEAEMLVKKMQDYDKHNDIFVGEVGKWLLWDPENKVQTEYMEKELNELYKNKLKNEEMAKIEFDKRVAESKRAMILENIEKAEKSGNKLTQTIDEEGNLSGVMENTDFESREAATEDMKEQQKKLLLEKFGK